MIKYKFFLTLLLFISLGAPASASLQTRDIGPFLELFNSNKQYICTDEGSIWAEDGDPLSSSPWPEDICGTGYSALLLHSETEICRLWLNDLEEADNGPAAPMTVSLLKNYRLNPLAIKKIELNINLFTNRLSDRFALWLGRSGKYIRMMKNILKEEGLPEDIAFLPLIESGFNTRAYSRRSAAGPWQFIAGTAKRYGLKVNWWVDERRDPVKSTRAAARYLIDLHKMFDSWSLALAAYNAGENKIKRALRKTRHSDYWGLLRTRYIKRETKNYVPKFIAARLIAVNPEQHGFDDVRYEEEFVYDEVPIRTPLTLDVIAKCAGTTIKTVKELNPELRRWSTPPVRKYTLRVPRGSREKFLERLAAIPKEKRFTFRKYKVRKGDTVSEISQKMGVPIRAIINYNKLGRRALIRKGQILVLPVPMGGKKEIVMEDLPTASLGNGREARVYTVRWGDTLSGISKVTGVSSSTIIAYNKIKNKSRIMAGQKLLIPTGKANN
jgi:membrane-bound lytic murein transglycosylase D